ncbi:MAG: hypothetical protein U1F68_01555 [Gammaproteobacteria bacterium]
MSIACPTSLWVETMMAAAVVAITRVIKKMIFDFSDVNMRAAKNRFPKIVFGQMIVMPMAIHNIPEPLIFIAMG